jgi:chemosensory pili system protein ChpE
MLLSTFLSGAAVAISLSAPPGPIAIETLRRGLRDGFRAALLVQLGSIVGDVAWCAGALFGLAPLVAIGWVRLLLGGIGVVVLAWLGVSGVKAGLSGQSASPGPALPSGTGLAGRGEPFRAGLVISFANPTAIAYWAAIGGALLASGLVGSRPASTAAFLGGFLAGVLAWAWLVALAVGRLHVRLAEGSRLWRGLQLACGLLLLGLAAALAWQFTSPLVAVQ